MKNRGVSPIIGVILLIVLTLVLSAYGAFYFFDITNADSKSTGDGIPAIEKENRTVELLRGPPVVVKINETQSTVLSEPGDSYYVPPNKTASIITVESDQLLRRIPKYESPDYNILFRYVERFNDNNFSSEWTTSKGSSGPNSWVREENMELQIRVDSGSSSDCGVNYAQASMGNVDNKTLNFSYDWNITTKGFWEDVRVYIYENGTEVMKIEYSGGFSNTINGTTNVTETIDGSLSMRFAIEPSPYCSNSDHKWTQLHVDNLTVNEAS